MTKICERCGNRDGGDGGDVEYRAVNDAYQCDRCYHLHTKPGSGGGARRRGGKGSGGAGRDER